jgi:hypothetical protein
MKIRKILLLVFLVGCLLLSGCDTPLLNPQETLTAPGATGVYRGAQKALEDAVGTDIILKYPLVEGVNTAFCPKDLDGDGQQEMLAFYRQATKGTVTRVNLIRNTKEGWESVQDLDPVGSDVVSVDFCDLNGDGLDEVCIGWGVSNIQSNQMSVYQTVNGLLVQRASESYTRHVFCDIDGDSVKELGLALLDTTKATSAISFFEMDTKDFSAVGSLSLDGSVISYANITAAPITSQSMGVYLDAYKGTDSLITELIYMKDGKLYNPFAGNQDNTNIATLRYCSLTSTDINKDGVVEIPFMERLPGYAQEDEILGHHLICWRYFNGNISDTALTWWYNGAEGYYLEIDTAWQGKISVVYDEKDKEYIFYRWNGEKVGERLFSIKRYTLLQWEEAAPADYAVLQKDSVSIWAAAVEEDNPLAITFTQIQNNFRFYIAKS